jgi:hypothetical protein
MAAIRFDKSKLNAFVQSPLFARNTPQGFRIYCGAKMWRGQGSFTSAFNQAPLGEVLYLGLQGSLTSLEFANTFQKYHGTKDRFGNGPPTEIGLPPNQDWTQGYTDDGSNPALSSGNYLGPFPSALSAPIFGSFLGYPSGPFATPPNYYLDATLTDTFYEALISGPYGDPSFHPLVDFQYTLGGPYSQSDVLAEAIAVARNVSLKGGQGSTGSYQEANGRNDIFGIGAYARSTFAAGNSLWYAGWHTDNIITDQKPWDGHQTHLTYRLTDIGDVYNYDFTKLNQGNLHKAYLVSTMNRPLDNIGGVNLCRVLCSSFAGAGALATYEINPNTNQRWPVRRACVDLPGGSHDLDPTFPTLSSSNSVWQIFFPGKRAADIPLPNTFWNS